MPPVIATILYENQLGVYWFPRAGEKSMSSFLERWMYRLRGTVTRQPCLSNMVTFWQSGIAKVTVCPSWMRHYAQPYSCPGQLLVMCIHQYLFRDTHRARVLHSFVFVKQMPTLSSELFRSTTLDWYNTNIEHVPVDTVAICQLTRKSYRKTRDTGLGCMGLRVGLAVDSRDPDSTAIHSYRLTFQQDEIIGLVPINVIVLAIRPFVLVTFYLASH